MNTGGSLSDLAAAGKQFGVAFVRIATACPDVAVWATQLDLPAAKVRQCVELLSVDEQARAERYRYARDRRRFIVARAGLRLLLSESLDLPAAAIRVRTTRHGKPFVAVKSRHIYFNVAHSEERAIYAISGTCRPGVDVEYLKRELDCEKLARRFFTHNEHAALQALPAPHRKQAFLECWTRKEAVIKALGLGLAMPLNRFEVTDDAALQLRNAGTQSRRIANCMLYQADAGANYIAAVAAYRPDRKQKCCQPPA